MGQKSQQIMTIIEKISYGKKKKESTEYRKGYIQNLKITSIFKV